MNAADRIPVLMYHRVGEVRSPAEARYCVAPARFAAHMKLLARRGHRAVDIDDFVGWLGGGPPLAQGAFVLTFDDGFRGVREHALPVLQQLGWPFTVFLVSDLLGGVDAWNAHAEPGVMTYPLLAPEEVLAMQGHGCSFQSHTRTHESLPGLDDDALGQQLQGSRRDLSRLLGRHVEHLAYPYGRVDARVESAARAAGYRAAFSVESGFNRRDVNPFRIRRLDVFGTDTPTALLRKMRFGSNEGSLWGALRYYGARAAQVARGR